MVGVRTLVSVYTTGRRVTDGAVWISSDVEIERDGEVRLGAGTIQSRCTIYGATPVGRDYILVPNAFGSSGTHALRLHPHLPIREQECRLKVAAPWLPVEHDAAVLDAKLVSAGFGTSFSVSRIRQMEWRAG